MSHRGEAATAGNRERRTAASSIQCKMLGRGGGPAIRVYGPTRSNKAGFEMPRDDNDNAPEQRCPICRGSMQVVRPESGVPGLPPGIRRNIIRCRVCELVTFQTFALEQKP
jgi:hypothetical protein